METQANGAVVVLGQGETGFLHASEVADESTSPFGGRISPGQEVVVKVIGFDRFGRPSLSLRQVTPQDREAMKFHREAQEMRSVLAGHMLTITPKQPEEDGTDRRLSRWIEEAEAALARLRRSRTRRSPSRSA